MWFVCGVCFLTVMASAVNAITVTPTYPLKNSAFTITATATGTSLSWIIDSTVLTGCTTALSFCEYVTPIRMPNANITIDSVTKISTISISNANQTLNGGLYDATGSVSKTVIVSTLPNSIRWKSHPVNGSSVDTGKWIAETSCAYPYDKITMDFTIFVEGVINSIQRVSTSSQSESCESPERMVLAELVLDSNSYANKRVYVVANASHDFFPNIPDIQGDQSNVVMFKVSTDQPCTDGDWCILVEFIPVAFVHVVLTICTVYNRIKIPKFKKNWILACTGISAVVTVVFLIYGAIQRISNKPGYCCEAYCIYVSGIGFLLLSVALQMCHIYCCLSMDTEDSFFCIIVTGCQALCAYKVSHRDDNWTKDGTEPPSYGHMDTPRSAASVSGVTPLPKYNITDKPSVITTSGQLKGGIKLPPIKTTPRLQIAYTSENGE